MLNGNPIGGKRRGSHYSDLWCMKYLPKFKWDNLTEEIEYQKALRRVIDSHWFPRDRVRVVHAIP